jgi:hypothetical protein
MISYGKAAKGILRIRKILQHEIFVISERRNIIKSSIRDMAEEKLRSGG